MKKAKGTPKVLSAFNVDYSASGEDDAPAKKPPEIKPTKDPQPPVPPDEQQPVKDPATNPPPQEIPPIKEPPTQVPTDPPNWV
ncbi:MAG: hypothetical protein K9J37_11615 [Saprospiraceae bacterium]|nr:hypothetical protein [Saprospiraceae bacterium]MCF8250554.1 hypothetical protein [Saprospiraceae bacterium]MCF8279694.1 hypothetical protein [Bacteroidales bacterium]MCF8312480.1 hypothetical protein [Saprospiraceae bacterium]MCF8440703.1 hypothetical protein [Saprospiraceae bacterium]